MKHSLCTGWALNFNQIKDHTPVHLVKLLTNCPVKKRTCLHTCTCFITTAVLVRPLQLNFLCLGFESEVSMKTIITSMIKKKLKISKGE